MGYKFEMSWPREILSWAAFTRTIPCVLNTLKIPSSRTLKRSDLLLEQFLHYLTLQIHLHKSHQSDQIPKQKYAQQMEDTEILQDTTLEPEQLPPTLQKIKMKWKIRCLQAWLSQQRKKTRNALKKSSELKKALSCLKGYLPSDSFAFIESQVVKAEKKSKHNYRWNTKEKVLPLSIYFHSKKAYCILSRLFVLPSMRTLQCDLQKMSIEPGFVENVFVALGQKVHVFGDTDWFVSLVFDEMSIKDGLVYNEMKDQIDGIWRFWPLRKDKVHS